MDFAQLDALKAKLESLGPVKASILAKLKTQFVADNIYNSNALEGGSLTPEDVSRALGKGYRTSKTSMRKQQEVQGHKEAFEYIVAAAEAGGALTEATIKEIHARLAIHDEARRGRYRDIPITVRGAAIQPPNPYLVPMQMEAMMAVYNARRFSRHVIEAVAQLHLDLEELCPFTEANTATGRMLVNLELMKAGYLPVDIKFNDRRRYYASFENYVMTGSMRMLAELLAEYEEFELRIRIALLEG